MIEYFMANQWQAWALLCIICLILELTSDDFFIMCFSLGAVAAAIVAAVGANLTTQIIAWVVASTLCLVFVRPFALKCLHKHEQCRPSNADALMGREGTVSQTIKAGDYGRVAIDGDDWKARSTSACDIPVGAKVRVTGRESIIITVETVQP